ncbi:MAG TPA: peptidase S10 [Gammaproteobacteria bacterium]|nr:peptidase S10 [Gammaproteobacteria bacterium]
MPASIVFRRACVLSLMITVLSFGVAEAAQDDAAQAIRPTRSVTHHSITIDGRRIRYQATAGTLVLRNDSDEAIGSMFYVAYTRDGVDKSRRPIAFAYNGGPGSASLWLHMGSFGPVRVVNNGAQPIGPAPYRLVDNAYSLLDKTDLVFIDAIDTGYSRIAGKGTTKDFFGVDEDVASFAQFIVRYVAENGRWNSPKYLLGESYGTTRSAALVHRLQSRDDMNFNGVILISTALNLQTQTFKPGNDLAYAIYLPTYAAVAWYHHALPSRPASLEAFLDDVEKFALGDYARALDRGALLGAAARQRILDRLHAYTGLSKRYLAKANLRVRPEQFEKELLAEHERTVGYLDARFTGPTMDPLSEGSQYDPSSAAISSAYVALLNQYLHDQLGYKSTDRYRADSGRAYYHWNWNHALNGYGPDWGGFLDVAPDLAEAMKKNPNLKVLVNSGYFDFATPFYAAVYTFHHLGLPAALQKNLRLERYPSGHMIYLKTSELIKLRHNIAAFIDATDNLR